MWNKFRHALRALTVGLALLALDAQRVAGANAQLKHLQVSIADAETGAPIRDAEIEYRNKIFRSDFTGKVIVPLQIEDYGAFFYVHADTYTPRRIRWRTPDLSEYPDNYIVKMQKGMTIGGRVVDEEGSPIVGATVYVLGTGSDMADDLRTFDDKPFVWDEEVVTDSQGAWVYDEFPAGRDSAGLRLTHPDFVSEDYYQRNENIDALKARTFELRMKKGLSLRGTVVDANGNPAANAFVYQGEDRFGSNFPDTRTDQSGAFAFSQVKRGKMVLTVVKPGWAPEIATVNIGADKSATVDIRLKTGNRVELRVVDPEGKPVRDAWVLPDSWRDNDEKGTFPPKYRTLEDISRATHDAGPLRYNKHTDDSGRFAWNWAPEDVVLYSVWKAGWASLRGVSLSARENSKTVTLYPDLALSGHVTDLATGDELKSFQVFHAHAAATGTPEFVQGYPIQGTNGHFVITFDEEDKFFWVKIDARGYDPFISRPVAISEGKVNLEVALSNANLVTARVTDTNGLPLPGVAVYLQDDKSHIFLENGVVSRDSLRPADTTDEAGKFAFSAPAGAYVLIGVSDTGFGYLPVDELTRGAALMLEPWAELEAEVYSGGTPGANQDVFLHPANMELRIPGGAIISYNMRTDAEGKAKFARVLPDRLEASVGVEQPEGPDGSMALIMKGTRVVELQPGEKKLIRLEF